MELPRHWSLAFDDVLRGVGGGLLFGVPLLYTMEMWWLGQTAEPRHALLALVGITVPVFFLIASSGFRRRPDLTQLEVLIDVVTAVGLGLASVAAVLVMLQRITIQTPLPIAAQMIVFEAAPFVIGAAVATEVFGGRGRDARQPDERRADQGKGGRDGEESDGVRGTAWDLGATAVGATFLGLSIAPTEEVPMLAAGIERLWLVVVIVASLLVTYAIVFTAGFSDEERRRKQIGVLQRPLTETFAAYLVSLAVSALMLWLFGNLGVEDPLGTAVAHTVVLSFPASIGGAAGRLVV